MTITQEQPINEQGLKMGQEMSMVTFGELVEHLTGVPFDEVYKDYLIHGEVNVKSNLE